MACNREGTESNLFSVIPLKGIAQRRRDCAGVRLWSRHDFFGATLRLQAIVRQNFKLNTNVVIFLLMLYEH